jgi:DNA polymerase III delta subunit
LRTFVRTPSLFSAHRLAAVQDAFLEPSKENGAILRGALARRDVTIVLSERGAPPPAYRFLASAGKKTAGGVRVQRFDILKGAPWLVFVRAEAAARRVRLDEEALRFLADLSAGDSWRLVTELEKLAPTGTRITRGDLAHLGLETPPEFWETLTRLKGRSTGERLGALERLLGAHEPAQRIFNILAYQLPERLAGFARADLAVKSGAMGYEEALADLMIDRPSTRSTGSGPPR